jgi:putative sterol carrier protein
MPIFPSKEWCEEAIRVLNSDPEVRQAGAGWVGDFGAIVEPERDKFPRAFCVHVVPRNGQIEKFEVLADEDDLDEIEPAYLVRAPYSVWKGLIRGTADPVEALMKGRIDLRGDLQPLLERLRYKGIATRVLASFETTFAEEERGHGTG